MCKTFRETEYNAAKLATSSLTKKDDTRESIYIKVEGHLFDKARHSVAPSRRFWEKACHASSR
jgi:hypothetical protein